MNARMGRVSISSDKADDMISHVRENVVPKYEGSDGFKGFTLLVDRSKGQAIGISFWDSEETMHASDELGDQARTGAASAGGGSDEGREYFEVAIDTMA
jgi:heme-degrading monooxygenase HmoA